MTDIFRAMHQHPEVRPTHRIMCGMLMSVMHVMLCYVLVSCDAISAMYAMYVYMCVMYVHR